MVNSDANSNKQNYIRWIVFAISCLLIALNIIRIIKVPITFDESNTFFDYVLAGVGDIIKCNPPTANNHIFNSLLTKFCVSIFHNNSPFVLRLPNLLAQVLYLYSTYILLQQLFGKGRWMLVAFPILNLNLFLFDFWGLCRGYGLSIALMAGSITLLFNYLQSAKLNWLACCIVLAMLAVYSNFALLNYYVGMAGVIIAFSLFFANSKRNIKWELLLLVSSVAVLYFLISGQISLLQENKQFYFGGDKGFITDTAYTVFYESFLLNQKNGIIASVIAYVSVSITLIAGLYWFLQLYKNRHTETVTGLLLWLLLLIPVAAIIVQHHLLNTLYLIERTALFLYPLFILQLVYFLFVVSKNHVPLFIPACVLGVILVCFFIININFSSTRTWAYDKNTLVVIERMIKNDKPIKVKLYWLFINSFKYYQQTKYGRELQHIELRWEEPPAGTGYDYYYIHRDEMNIVPTGYIDDTTFFDRKYVLLKKQD